jgi:hypothetical protein
MSVTIKIKPEVLMLREQLLECVAQGELSAGDYSNMFVEEITVRVDVDGRFLRRLGRDGNGVGRAIAKYRKATA